ncbi:MAG: glycosyltransferase family 4 protein [Actinomycetota bacterium]|nr:glycosyltransferase family 4 protein [Actinomycetota bacterium]
MPVPLDRRVWLECRSLRANGYDVSVICPKGPGDPAREKLEGIHIYKYRPAPIVRGAVGYMWEFVYSWLRTAALSAVVWRRRPFQFLQACNPPDTYWALARLWKRRGVTFVFDHHDLNPELFLSRFGAPRGLSARLQLQGLKWLELRTFATAEHVVSTNDSYRQVALTRGRLRPDRVTVVRSGPDTRAMRPIYPTTPGPRRFELAYLGIMGPQDRVDILLDVMQQLVTVRGRTDVHATFMGFGDCLDELKVACTARGLDEVVTFTGRADKTMIARVLSGADVGLCPDPKTPLNDVSTMNKQMEYMAYALPTVTFDLAETRVSAGDTALYVDSGDVRGFADAVERLLDDEDLRLELALRARARVAQALDWRTQARKYVGAYHRLMGSTAEVVDPPSTAPHEQGPGVFVDLDDEAELRRFILERRAPGRPGVRSTAGA